MSVYLQEKMAKLIEHPRAGVLLAVFADWTFTLMDAFSQRVEHLGLPPGELAFIRMSITSILTAMVLYKTNRDLLKTMFDKSQALAWTRAAVMALCILFFYAGLEYLSISEIVTIFHLRPFPTALLCLVVLKEAFTWVQAVASVVSFGAVLLVVRPDFSEAGQIRLIGFVLIFVLLLLSSLDIVFCRMLGPDVDPTFLLLTYAMMSVLFGPIWMVIQQTPPVALTTPMILPLVGVIVFGWIAQTAIVSALKREKGTTIAVVGYSQIAFSVIVQAVYTATYPPLLSILGMTIITAAGVWSALKGSPPEEEEKDVPLATDYEHLSESEEV